MTAVWGMLYAGSLCDTMLNQVLAYAYSILYGAAALVNIKGQCYQSHRPLLWCFYWLAFANTWSQQRWCMLWRPSRQCSLVKAVALAGISHQPL